jgi:AraC-like DNA-binding protein
VKKQKDPIPRFSMLDTAKAGISISSYKKPKLKTDHDVYIPHRDTHYLLIVLISGSYTMRVDFNELYVKKGSVVLVSPGQVHQLVNVKDANGYSIAFDTSFMSEPCKGLLEYYFRQEQILSQVPLFNKLITLCELMQQLHDAPPTSFTISGMHALLQSMLTLMAGHVEQYQLDDDNKPTRAHHIEQLFKQLLQANFKQWKKPAEYAKAMNISVSHLNDTIKEITGDSVTYHIQEVIILEAKRLLYHTNLTAKEICFEVGYEDAVYFSRLFKKVTGTSPLSFRQQFRD